MTFLASLDILKFGYYIFGFGSEKLTDRRHDNVGQSNEQYISLVKMMTRWPSANHNNDKKKKEYKSNIFCASTNGCFGHDPFIALSSLYP